MIVEKKCNSYFIYNLYYEQLSEFSTKYVLDSNIIANLEFLYYKPEKMPMERKLELLELLNYLRGKKIDYKYALTELSTNYTEGGIIEQKYKYTKKAIQKLLNMSPSKLKGHIKYGKNKENTFIQNTSAFNLPSKIVPPTLMLLAEAYTPLSKLFYEIKTKKDKEKIFSNFLTFLVQEMHVISLYEVGFATYLLFTNDDEFRYVQSLLKVNNKIDIDKKVWNVCWDITFLRYINSLSGRIMSNEDIPNKSNFVLITQDKALGELSSLLKGDSLFTLNGKTIPNMIIDTHKIKSRYLDTYQKTYNNIMNEDAIKKRQTFLSNCDTISYHKEILRKADELITLLHNEI